MDSTFSTTNRDTIDQMMGELKSKMPIELYCSLVDLANIKLARKMQDIPRSYFFSNVTGLLRNVITTRLEYDLFNWIA